MAYCILADIKKAIPEVVIIQLTDDDNIGEIVSANVNKAIAAADATIDAYCQRYYTIPLNPVPPKIVEISADIAIYNLYSRSDLPLPEIRKDRNDAAIKFLEKVAKGDIDLGAASPAPTDTSNGAESNFYISALIFSRDKIKGF
jgi:phage gp36-like protein